MSNNKNYTIPAKERALVLQGGGSLGAMRLGHTRAYISSFPNGIEIMGKRIKRPLTLLLGHQLVP